MIIITKKKSRWRGQSFPCIGTFDNYYICRVGTKNRLQYTKIHKSEVRYCLPSQKSIG